ncbi:MAG: cytochrome c oxidase assembly protein, partial [Firmicutes bacterium]|nr:cytochrome c oxidase assembly protein [Bacillota bacterium]
MGATLAAYGPFALWHPEVALLVVLLAILYHQLVGPLAARFGAAEPVRPGQIAAMYGALLLLYASIGSPLELLADRYLFAAHMLQFVLLTKVMPPLLLAALPPWFWRTLRDSPGVGPPWRFMTRPAVAVTFFSGLFTVLQLPAVLDPSLRSNALYVLEQLVQLLAGVWMWWPVLASEDRLTPGMQLLYLFVAAEFMMPVVFWLLFLTNRPLYAPYGAGDHLFLTAVSDQELGAILMFVGMIVS